MPLAVSWVQYDTTTPTVEEEPFKHDLPLLDLGVYRPDAWGSTTGVNNARKFVVGLRLQGLGAKNIKIWMDGDRADIYLKNNDEPRIRQNHEASGYIFKITDLDVPRTALLKPCKLATIAVLPNTPTYSNGTDGVGATLTAGANAAIGSIDGVAVALNDRILVKNQAAALQNGIYIATSLGSGAAPWVLERVDDFNQHYEICKGLRVQVTHGSTASGYYSIWLSDSALDPPYQFGTDPIRWIKGPTDNVLADCVVATQANVVLAGSAPSTLDGVSLLKGDRILVRQQSAPEENGIYVVATLGTGSNGTWTRATELNQDAEICPLLMTRVQKGTDADVTYVLDIDTAPAWTINTTPLYFDTPGNVMFNEYSNVVSRWNPFPNTLATAQSVKSATLTKHQDAYSGRIGLVAYVPAGEPDQDLRNFCLMAEFDTTDE